MPIPTDEERLGTRLAGRYDLRAILGRGGMGVVYDAEHVYTRRRVAVKLLKPAMSADPKRTKRMLREARAAAKLAHEGVVDVLDMGEDEGTMYLVLEHLEGRDLEAELDARGRLPVGEVLALAEVVLGALAKAHASGILHRDVKPSNVFLAMRDGRRVPTLLDFGLAKARDAEKVTTTGTVLGTPHYMAPEAAAADEELGPAADVWSTAVMLYECLGGRRPFEGPTPSAVLMNVLRKEAPRLKLDEAPAVAAVVMRGLSKGTARIRDAVELREALRDAAREDGVTATSVAVEERPAARSWTESIRLPVAKRPRGLLAFGVAAVVGLGIAVAGVGDTHEGEREAASEAPLANAATRVAGSPETSAGATAETSGNAAEAETGAAGQGASGSSETALPAMASEVGASAMAGSSEMAPAGRDTAGTRRSPRRQRMRLAEEVDPTAASMEASEPSMEASVSSMEASEPSMEASTVRERVSAPVLRTTW